MGITVSSLHPGVVRIIDVQQHSYHLTLITSSLLSPPHSYHLTLITSSLLSPPHSYHLTLITSSLLSPHHPYHLLTLITSSPGLLILITLSPAHKVDTDLNQHSKFFHLFALAVKYTGVCVCACVRVCVLHGCMCVGGELNTISHLGIARTPRDGAATTINCAVNPQLNSQQAHYYSDCHVTQSSDLSR